MSRRPLSPSLCGRRLWRPSRRNFLRLGAAGLAGQFVGGRARAAEGLAKRVIFLYWPDGIPGLSEIGEPSLWHASGTEHAPILNACQSPLEAYKSDCVFFNGLSLGDTDEGTHPGGATKLLTGADQGMHESIDQYLARTVGAEMPWRHLYLGVQSNFGGAGGGDKYISYPLPGISTPAEDDPLRAFESLFGFPPPSPPSPPPGRAQASVIDTVLEDLNDLRTRLGRTEAAKLDLHLEALREVELRIDSLPGTTTDPSTTTKTSGTTTGTSPPWPPAFCDTPSIPIEWESFEGRPKLSGQFPGLLLAQTELMILAMACGKTRVGTLQCSSHTSELAMNEFVGTPFYDPYLELRNHQASHYGSEHSGAHFDGFFLHVQWWMERLAYLIQRLSEIPEDDGTMLDHSLIVCCTEVCDGNLHDHHNVPFVLAGRGSGTISTGRLMDVGFRRHADLWISIANAMGEPIESFGDTSSGPIPGLLS